jgi:hypothetical protein
MPKESTLQFALVLAVIALCNQAFAQVSGPASSSKSPTSTQDVPSPGEIANNVYRNAWFGFSCRFPYGWVDRTDAMREPSKDGNKEMVLLGTFERPPEATGSSVNSSVVIAAEATSAYPGIKEAAQYFGPLNEITHEQGLEKVNEVYEFPVDGKPVVREDFVKKIGGVGLHQSTLAWLTQGYIVSFTFIGGSDDEVQSLIEGLKIDYARKPAKASAKSAKP